jgi:DSF synthase
MSGTPLAARFDDRHLIGHARPARPSLPPPAPVPAHLQVAAERYDELEVSLDPQTRTYWCSMAPKGAPSFTPGLLRDLAAMQRSIRQLCTRAGSEEADAPVRHYVLKSSIPGIFNLGGDLGLFANRIRARDRDSLRTYAYACVDVLYNNFVAFDRSVITVALVEGDALGGGFEAALSCDIIIAERGAKFGLPEVLFNLFPGMGACSMLSRRIGLAAAERMILSGEIFTAEQLHAMGLVQIVAEPGKGQEAVKAYIEQTGRRFNAHSAVFRAGRRVNPLTLRELRDVTDMWVDAALRVTPGDLRKMERLKAAQHRRNGTPAL